MNIAIVILCFLAALFSFFAFVGACWITTKLLDLEKRYCQDQVAICKVLLRINDLGKRNNQDQKEFLAFARETIEHSMNK